MSIKDFSSLHFPQNGAIASKAEKNQVVKQLLTDRQKAERKAKREANPQFSHLVSAKNKEEIAAFKLDAKRNLIEAKRLTNKLDFTNGSNVYENEATLKASKKLINALCKDEALIEASIVAVRTHKGKFSPFFYAQLIQKLVKLIDKHQCSYISALKMVIEAKAKK